jgi:hypothetical protein
MAPRSGELTLARPFKAGDRRNNYESVALATADLNKINNLDLDRCLILVRRRDATHNVVSPLIPALKGRAKVRGRYAAQKLCGNRRDAGALRGG